MEGVKSWRNRDSGVRYTLHSLQPLMGPFTTWLCLSFSPNLYLHPEPQTYHTVSSCHAFTHLFLVFFPFLALWLSSFCCFFKTQLKDHFLLGLSLLPEGFRYPGLPFHSTLGMSLSWCSLHSLVTVCYWSVFPTER